MTQQPTPLPAPTWSAETVLGRGCRLLLISLASFLLLTVAFKSFLWWSDPLRWLKKANIPYQQSFQLTDLTGAYSRKIMLKGSSDTFHQYAHDQGLKDNTFIEYGLPDWLGYQGKDWWRPPGQGSAYVEESERYRLKVMAYADEVIYYEISYRPASMDFVLGRGPWTWWRRDYNMQSLLIAFGLGLLAEALIIWLFIRRRQGFGWVTLWVVLANIASLVVCVFTLGFFIEIPFKDGGIIPVWVAVLLVRWLLTWLMLRRWLQTASSLTVLHACGWGTAISQVILMGCRW